MGVALRLADAKALEEAAGDVLPAREAMADMDIVMGPVAVSTPVTDDTSEALVAPLAVAVLSTLAVGRRVPGAEAEPAMLPEMVGEDVLPTEGESAADRDREPLLLPLLEGWDWLEAHAVGEDVPTTVAVANAVGGGVPVIRGVPEAAAEALSALLEVAVIGGVAE